MKKDSDGMMKKDDAMESDGNSMKKDDTMGR